MTKSKCEQELEKMREERDHWRRLAQERKEENSELKRYIERQNIYAQAFKAGLSVVDQELLRIQRERDAALFQINVMNQYVPDNSPVEVILRRDIEPGTIKVGIAVAFRFGPGKDDWEGDVYYSDFHGTYEEAMQQTLPSILLASKQVPLPSDISSPPDGISMLDLMPILDELAAYRYGQPEKYEEKRREAFDKVCNQMLATGLYKDGRSDAMNSFYHFVKRTFEAAEKRYSATQRMLHS